MEEVDKGDLVREGILPTERLNRSKGAEIWGSEHDNARKPGGLFKESGTGNQAAHAMGHEVHPGAFGLDLSGQLLAEPDQVDTPVIGKEVSIVARNPQLQFELKIRKENDS